MFLCLIIYIYTDCWPVPGVFFYKQTLVGKIGLWGYDRPGTVKSLGAPSNLKTGWSRIGEGRYWPRITKVGIWGRAGTGRASIRRVYGVGPVLATHHWGRYMGSGRYWPRITEAGTWGGAGTGRASLRPVNGVGPVRFQIDPRQPWFIAV